MAISTLTRKALWARAGNTCAICDTQLVLETVDGRASVVGEECHIVARQQGGPRGEHPVDDLDGYDNLILLCSNCHKLVDDQPERYSMEHLREVKRNHETRIALGEPARAASPDGRTELLERALRESQARCADRWQALGVSRDLAFELAEDSSVGAPPPELRSGGPVLVLTGDVGSGKSLAGERLHQAAISAALDDPDAPVPIWVRASDVAGRGLQRAVADTPLLVGVDAATKCVALTVDGLDEAGPAAVAELVSQARVLAELRPGSRVVLSARALGAVGVEAERRTMPLLDEEEARVLMNRLDPKAHNAFLRLVDPVRTAARRPLFAVAAAVLTANGESVSSTADLIDTLVRRTLGDRWQALHEPLTVLAVQSVRRDGRPVRSQEVVPVHALDDLLATRLVVEDAGHLRFPLILIAQWFAGHAIVAGTVSLDALLDDVGRLENWRYPLAIAVSAGPEDRVAEILATVTRRQPAFASIVLGEAVARLPSRAPDVDDALAAGRALRAAAQSWADGLAGLAPWVLHLRADGRLPSLGVDLDLTDDRGRLTTSWQDEAPDRSDVFALPPWRSLGEIPAGSGRSGQPVPGPAWPWEWMRKVIQRSLKDVVGRRALPLGGSPLEHEVAWDVASRLVATRVDGAIPVEEIMAADPETPFLVRDEPVDMRSLQDALSRQAGDDGLLRRPWPTKDEVLARAGQDGWARHAEGVFRTALDAYAWMAEGLLAPLAPRLLTAALLPVVAHGVVSVEGDNWAWTLEPAPADEGNQADFELLSRRNVGSLMTMVRESGPDSVRTLRPDVARWASTTGEIRRSELESRSPATRLVYAWLWRDLVRIGLADGQLAEWSYYDLPNLRAGGSPPVG